MHNRFQFTFFSGGAAILLLVVGSMFLGSGCTKQSQPDDGRITIGAIVFQEDQYFRLIEYGMQDAAKKLNVKLMLNNSFGTLDKEISVIDTYLANRVDALVVAPLSAQSSIPALQRAFDRASQSSPTIVTSTQISPPATSGATRSNWDVGRVKRLRHSSRKLGGKARLALVEYISLAPEPARQRVQGFRDEVTKLPGVEIVTEQDAWLAPEATAMVEEHAHREPRYRSDLGRERRGYRGCRHAATAANKRNTGKHI